MYHRTITPLAAALALAGLTPMAGGAQSAPSSPTIALSLADRPLPARPALKPVYHVRLTSTWPQEAAVTAARRYSREPSRAKPMGRTPAPSLAAPSSSSAAYTAAARIPRRRRASSR